MRNTFDDELDSLNTYLMEMGTLTERAINSAIEALIDRDSNAASEAVDFEVKVDEKEKQIENLCFKLLLKQQPVARDFRSISAALKMITDMERIGDQAADIAGIVTYLKDEELIKKLEHLPKMAQVTSEMVIKSIDAFIKRDIELANETIAQDDEVDELFDIVKNELIECIRTQRESASQAIDLLMIAKYFERIGDHAQNIAEWVSYSITGIHA